MKGEEWRPPSLYDGLIEDVAQYANTKRPVLLTGGRGLGKTFVLNRVSLRNKKLVSLADTKDIGTQLFHDLTRHPGALLIDDIDSHFDEQRQELLEYLANHHRHPVVATSTLPPDLSVIRERGGFRELTWDSEKTSFWSNATQQMQHLRVDPWAPGWRSQIADSVMRVVGAKSREDHDVSGWTTILLDLTGGHPVMLDAALAEVRRTAHGKIARGWRQDYVQMEEHLFSTGLRRVRKFMTWIDELDSDAGKALRQLASGDVQAADLPVEVRRTLIDTGFVCRSPSQEIVIAGEVLRRFLAQRAEGREEPVSFVVTPTGGDLRVTIANSTVILALRGAAWKLVTALRESSRPLSMEELANRTGEDVGALRSALQRLRNELQAHGVDCVIENVWGEGYRIGAFPLLLAQDLRD